MISQLGIQNGTWYPSSKFGMVHDTPALAGCYTVYQYMMGCLGICRKGAVLLTLSYA